MPNITIHGEPKSFADPLTVADLLRHFDRDPRKVAVEVNDTVVPRVEHAEHRLKDGDAVEITGFIGGG
jgi:thiamine biosynthesis protein ThiS